MSEANTKRRIDTLGFALATVIAICVVAGGSASLYFGWFHSPWELAACLIVGMAFAGVSLAAPSVGAPRPTNVHGDARTASEEEAKAAARGDRPARDLHDRRYPD